MFNFISRKFCKDFTNPQNLSRIDKSMLKPFYSALTKRINDPELQNTTRMKSLYYYRRLLIAINGCYDSNIHVQSKVEEIKSIFKDNENLQGADDIGVLHNLCQDILNKIETG